MADEKKQLEKISSTDEHSLIRPMTAPRHNVGSYDTGYGYGGDPEEGLHLRDLWRIVRKRKRLVIALSFLSLILITIEVHRTPSIYRAEAILEIADESPSLVRTSEQLLGIDQSKTVKAKKVIFKSRPVLEDIVESLKLDQNPKFIDSLQKRSVADAVKDIYYRIVSPFTHQPVSVTPQDRPLDPTSVRRTRSSEESQRLAPYVEILKEKLIVDSVDETNILKLTFDHTDPVIAATVINTASKSIIDRHFESRISRFSDTSSWLERSTRDLKAKVQEAEQALADYTQRNRIFSVEGKQSLTSEKLGSLHSQAMRSEIDRMLKQSLYEDVQKGHLEQLPEVFTDSKANALQVELGRLKVEEAELSVKFGPENPQLIQVQSKIRSLTTQIKESRQTLEEKLKADYERAVRDEKSLRTALDKAKSEAVNENQASIQFHILTQEVETAKSLYNDFLQKTKQAELQLAEQYNNLRVIEPATIPTAPVGPQRVRTILIGLLVSLLGALGLAFFLEYLDNTVKSVEDIGRLVQLPTLAVIPSISSISTRALTAKRRELMAAHDAVAPLESESSVDQDPIGDGENPQTTKLVTIDQLSTVVEAYRMLRTSVLLSTAGKPPKTILFTSGQPGEGKTTTAINTAISLSQLGSSVLLIDADLRRPTLHRVFKINQPLGLSTCLSREMEIDPIIRRVWVPNLSVLPCGPIPPNPAELISSEKMKELLSELSNRYDHILIDSPPLINVTDPVILSTLVDGVILVVHAGRSTREVVRRARHELTTVGARIFGVVLNNLDVKREGYGGYSGYSNYGYYTENREEAGGGR